jgi:RND family efflux transporter MFP subunit
MKKKPRLAGFDRLPRVEVVRPRRTTPADPLVRKIEVAATVEPLQRVDLCARVPGTVDYLPKEIDIGRKVKKGDQLVHLAVPDLEAEKKQKEAYLEQVRNQVEQAKQAKVVAEEEVKEARAMEQKYVADYEFQKLRFERINKLVRLEAQDRQLADEAQKQMATAEASKRAATVTIRTRQAKALAAAADVEVAKRKVEVAVAEVKKLGELIALATITAPFDGYITRRWVDVGATIKDAGAPLLTVMEVHRVRVVIDIPQREEKYVDTEEDSTSPGHPADKVVVKFPDLEGKGAMSEFKGSITRLSKALDPVTRTMQAEVELANVSDAKGQLILKAGMYGKAEVTLDERANALTVPATALVRRGEGKIGMFVVAGAKGRPARGELKFVELALGLDDGLRVEVLGEQVEKKKVVPLKGDELVVARGNGVLRNGEEVYALEAQDE